MIVEPDFLTHWKTLLLIDLLNDKSAPLYVLHLWTHCYQRRTDDLSGLPEKAIRIVCGCPHENILEALIEAGFVVRDGDKLTAHNFMYYNRSLLAMEEEGQR